MIYSPSNPVVKELQALNLGKRRKERGLFLVEGVRLVADGLRAGSWPHLCIYDEESLRKTGRGRDLLRMLRDPRSLANHPGSVLEATERAVRAASNTEHPQGVVAAFSIPKWELDPSASATPLVLICDDVQDPGNLGTIMRTSEAAGVTALFLTPECVDIYNPKVVRAGMGAHFRLPSFPDLTWPDIEDKLALLAIPLTNVYSTDASAPLPYDDVQWSNASALVISNEAHGPSPTVRALAARTGGFLSIPMQGDAESLNAASAAAIILFEAARQRRTSTLGHPHTP
jgi:TrmH family RNA methyltransferase